MASQLPATDAVAGHLSCGGHTHNAGIGQHQDQDRQDVSFSAMAQRIFPEAACSTREHSSGCPGAGTPAANLASEPLCALSASALPEPRAVQHVPNIHRQPSPVLEQQQQLQRHSQEHKSSDDPVLQQLQQHQQHQQHHSLQLLQPPPVAVTVSPVTASAADGCVAISLSDSSLQAQASLASPAADGCCSSHTSQEQRATRPKAMSEASITSSSSSSTVQECRICLSADAPQDMVEPCSCSGTVRYAHMECLKAWVAERGVLECELCHQPYKESLRKQLMSGSRPRSSLRTRLQAGSTDGSQAADGGQPAVMSPTRFWVHLGIMVMLLVAVLYLALFVNVGASDNFWLLFLWRTVTCVLPLFLAARCIAALYAWRRHYLEVQAARRQQQQQAQHGEQAV